MTRLYAGLAALLLAAAIGCQDKPTAKEEPPATPANAMRDWALLTHHDRCVELFVKTEGFGGGRMVILSHPSPSYPKSLDLPAEPELDAAGRPIASGPTPWVMDKVELVSLLQNETPGVYPAEGMREFFRKRPKARELDGFESRALSKLQGGEAIDVDATPGQLRVLGSIRKTQACQGCHDKPDGALLGAFTYTFKPASGVQ